jgi:mannosyl-glycoprotein endo-beta-N-acetylglucosaminidase
MRRARRAGLGVLAATVAALLAGGVAQGADVRVGALASSSHMSCTLGSGPENAVDGAASNIYTDKWCVPTGRPTLTLQLSGSLSGWTVSHIVVKHAGAGGESPALNTRAFQLRVRTSPLAPWIPIAAVAGNSASVTDHPVGIAGVFDVQLLVDVPTQTLNPATRIYEVEVWGTPRTSSGVLGGNVVQIPVSSPDPIQVCDNNLAPTGGTQAPCPSP